MQYSLSRALYDTQLELTQLTSREVYVITQIRAVQNQLACVGISEERRRQLTISLEDHRAELRINRSRQIRLRRCLVDIQKDQADLNNRLFKEKQKQKEKSSLSGAGPSSSSGSGSGMDSGSKSSSSGY